MTAIPRTIPIRFQPVVGESLESWLWAYAHRLRVKPIELLDALQLVHSRLNTFPDCTVRLLPSELNDLSTITDIDAGIFRAMTLDRFHKRVLFVREDKPRSIDRYHLWARPTGSRFCPYCLADSGGRWQLAWRLSWTFACAEHRCLLLDRCPSCGAIPRGYQGVGYLVAPGFCTARLAGQHRSARCRTNLKKVKAPILRSGRVLRAQDWINTRIDGSEPDSAVRDALVDLSSIVGRIFNQHRADLLYGIGKRFGDAFTNAEKSGNIKLHRSTFPIVDSTLTAGALTVAVEALDVIDRGETSRAVKSIVARDHESRWGTAPSNYFTEWNFGSERLRTAVIQAHSARFTNVDGLRYRIATPTPRVPRSNREFAARHIKIPQMCWRNTALALNPGVNPKVFRPALSVALLLPGSPGRDIAPLSAKLENPFARRVSQVLRQLKKCTGAAGVQAICALADYLDSIEPIIDYQRRRRLIGPNLLPPGRWKRLCGRVGFESGGDRREKLARSYLYSLLSGNALDAAPEPFGFARPYERAGYNTFVYCMTSEIYAALNEYANEYLVDRGIDGEPLTWEPPFEVFSGLALPGPGPGSLDWHTVHEQIDNGDPTCSVLAHRLGTSEEHVRCLLADHPRPPKPPSPRTVASASARYIEVQNALPPRVFVDLAQDGCTSVRGISARTGISRQLVARRMREIGIAVPEPGGRARVIVNREWLWRRYIDDHRTTGQIATELGATPSTVQRLIASHEVPMRPRGAASHIEHLRIRDDAPRGYPEPLRLTLTGEGAWTRLARLDAVARCRSFRGAAAALKADQNVLSTQVARLEKETRCKLLERNNGIHSVVPTQNGRKLLAQLHQFRPDRSRPCESITQSV
ncbi:TniQ family protein [Rhodococcus sp. MS13]|uniref:TniQ family protein n=1 Tax=Rhodococcus sp. MS13 TaxID=2579940 RepID=UPI001562CA97|nr:TniQ family protein [Rhodococcus sp. MS13]NRH32741.1 LysR family transcriptional regulator [Rhodococcus sp. MS13]